LREIVLEGSPVSPVILDEPCAQKTLVFLARVADPIYPAPSDTKTQREKQRKIALLSASFWIQGKDRMLIGYVRVSKSDGSQTLDLQRDALSEAGVDPCRIYEDLASGRKDDRPGLASCLKALQPGNTLVVWKLDRLGRDLKHLVGLVDTLHQREVGLKVLAGAGAQIDTTTANGRFVFGIFAALAEFEAELIRERTKAGLMAARARGRLGGRPRKMTATTLKMAMTAMADPASHPKEVARRLGISTSTLYAYVNGDGSLKEPGRRLVESATVE
jgi:DNA invertase Pin-like site-specific DNA recombinase